MHFHVLDWNITFISTHLGFCMGGWQDGCAMICSPHDMTILVLLLPLVDRFYMCALAQ